MVRLISNVPKLAHTTPLFESKRILTVNQLYLYNVGIFMHRLVNGKQPRPFTNMFQINRSIHSYETRQSTHFHTPIGRTTFAYKTIKFKGVSIYNNISISMETNCTIVSFKKHLK